MTSTTSSIHCWDIRTGVLLASFKGTTANTPPILMNPQKSPSFVLQIQSDKPLILGYSYSKAASILKYIMPEKLSCLNASRSTDFVVGGGDSGRIYLWETISGTMVGMFDAHYKPVSQIIFSIDDKTMYTGGEDGMIHSYATVDVISQSGRDIKPRSTLSGHSLPITGLAIGFSISDPSIYSCSLDRTVKIWRGGKVLSSIIFPRALTCLAVDVSETRLYAGSVDGIIYTVELYGEERMQQLEKHTSKVTSLALSMDETLLISSSEDASCLVWDTSTRQPLLTFAQMKGPAMGCSIGFMPAQTQVPIKVDIFQRYQSDRDHKVTFGRAERESIHTLTPEEAFNIAKDLVRNGLKTHLNDSELFNSLI